MYKTVILIPLHSIKEILSFLKQYGIKFKSFHLLEIHTEAFSEEII